jgi:hypothetical protein
MAAVPSATQAATACKHSPSPLHPRHAQRVPPKGQLSVAAAWALLPAAFLVCWIQQPAVLLLLLPAVPRHHCRCCWVHPLHKTAGPTAAAQTALLAAPLLSCLCTCSVCSNIRNMSQPHRWGNRHCIPAEPLVSSSNHGQHVLESARNTHSCWKHLSTGQHTPGTQFIPTQHA